MASVKSRNTRPEVALRKALWHRGLRYRIGHGLPGTPDVVFPAACLAVFIDGDFWHGNAWRIRGMSSFEDQFERLANPEFWRKKIADNVARDERVTAQLEARGWLVYRVFESRLWADFDGVVAEIETLVRSRCKNMGGHKANADRSVDAGTSDVTSTSREPDNAQNR